MSNATLITGADGYLGLRVVERLLSSSDAPIMLWVRSASQAEMQSKSDQVKRLFPDWERHSRRVSFHTGDLSRDNCFESINDKDVARIIHCAAVTRFNVDAATAQAVNIDGTRKLVDLARHCANLQSLCYVSTIYASGTMAGIIDEAPLGNDITFSNHYERSKWNAERVLIDEGAQLPWTIVRVATVLADDDSGHVTQQNAVHNTLKLMFYGLLSVLPGVETTPLYLITGDFAADCVAAVCARGQAQTVYHASYNRSESLTLGTLVDLTYETFLQDASFKKRRVLKPLYTDLDAFSLLSDASGGFGDGIMKQALSSVSPFARQMYIEKDVRNTRMQELLNGAYNAPDPESLVRNACRYLTESKWGKVSEVAV